ncbi:MAG: hypothetical protein WD469_08410 [Paenibacillaceae bacterium]
MSFLDVYIGELDDSNFDYDDGDWNGNCPARKSDFFPRGREIFRLMINKIETGELEGKRVDWGAWIARMLPYEMLTFVSEFYKDTTEAQNIIRFIRQLEPNKRYALVASEF